MSMGFCRSRISKHHLHFSTQMQIKNIHLTMGLLQIKVRFYCLVAAQISCMCHGTYTKRNIFFGWQVGIDGAVPQRLRYAVETAGAIWWAPLCSRVASTEAMLAECTAISVMCFGFSMLWSLHYLVHHVIQCLFVCLSAWFLSKEERNQLLHALFGNVAVSKLAPLKEDAWQTFFDNKKAAKGSLTKPTSLNKQGQPKKSKAIPDSKLSVHSRVPWASLELVSEFTDGSSTLPQLSKAIQNGKGVVFCELNEMESMLQLSSENALAILVPPKADRQRLPTGFTGSGCNIVVIAKQAGVEVLKHCILYQLGHVNASLGVRTAEVELPVARTVEFHAPVACEQESLALHKALSSPTAVDEWSKCLSQHFEVQPVEVYGAVLPKDPSRLATVKLRIPADKAEEFDKKSGVGCIVVRRWIPKGANPPKTPVVWLKGSQATSCSQALTCARRFEGFLGLVHKDGKYGAKYQPEHIKAARTALDPGRFSSENLSLVPTSSWAIDGFPSGTDREQVRSLLQAWGWTTIPSHVVRSTWIVRADSSPPATRCYASCGPLLVRSLAPDSVTLPVMTSAASGASVVSAPVSAPVSVVKTDIPLALQEEISKAVAKNNAALTSELSTVKEQIADMKAEWSKQQDSMAKNVEKVGACQEATAVQVQELRQDMAKLDINAAVTNALSNALPAALGSVLPGLLSSAESVVPSPLRKKGKQGDDMDDAVL